MSFISVAQMIALLLGIGALLILSMRLLQRLQWRLTFCYILVTVVAVPVLIIPLALSDPGPQQDVASVLASRVAPRVAAYLEQTPLNREALLAWATAFVHRTSDQETVFAETILGETSGPIMVVVLDQSRQVVLSATSGREHGAEFVATPQAQLVIRVAEAAQDGKLPLASLTRPLLDGRTAVAVPLRAYDGRPLGVLLTVVNLQTAQRELIVSALSSLPQNILPLTVLASILGALAGVLASHNITRRVRRLAQAAHAWSRGEFQMLIRDSSRDELGQLARDFNRMAEQVQSLLARQQGFAIIEERHRVARDLHDGVKQHLFATTLLIGAAKTLLHQDAQAAETYLMEAEELATQTRKDLTTIIQELRPVTLAAKGLVAVLQEYTMLWSRRTGIALDLQTTYATPASLDLEETLLRVAQEALANVARHSEASQAQVHLRQECGLLRLTILDDGKGFDVARAEYKGLGILHMRERVEAHHGQLRIISAATGTMIEVSLPSTLTPPSGSHEAKEMVHE